MRKNIYSSITGRGLCFLIYKEFIELSNKKTPNRKKLAKDTNEQVTIKDVNMT